MTSAVLADPVHDVEESTPPARTGPAVALRDAPSGAQVRALPGGGRIVELRCGPEHLTLVVSGEIDGSDQHAVIDVVTGGILRGSRQVRFDASRVTFVDVSVLRALSRCHRFLARSGGRLIVTGLRAPLDEVWSQLEPESGRDASGSQDQRPRLIGAPTATVSACA